MTDPLMLPEEGRPPASLTQEQIDAIQEASRDIARIGILAEWAARGVLMSDSDQQTGAAFADIGLALEWTGQQIAQRCAVIDEGLSHAK